MKVFGYLRVSTSEQADSGAGLEAQRQTIAAEAARRGWSVDWITDAGYSAKSLNRPGIAQALELLRTGEAEALVVAKLDRLSRSMLDFAAVMERSRLQGWAVVALDVNVDTTTPSGELIAGVMAQFAHYERRLIGQRTKDALAVKRSQGVRLGRPPVLTDSTRSKIAALRASGLTFQGIADRLNTWGTPTAQGGARWYPSTVRTVLLGIERAA